LIDFHIEIINYTVDNIFCLHDCFFLLNSDSGSKSGTFCNIPDRITDPKEDSIHKKRDKKGNKNACYEAERRESAGGNSCPIFHGERETLSWDL
jgi:hypothetical protein